MAEDVNAAIIGVSRLAMNPEKYSKTNKILRIFQHIYNGCEQSSFTSILYVCLITQSKWVGAHVWYIQLNKIRITKVG